MLLIAPEQLDIFQLEDSIWIASAETGLAVYDFSFQTYFACRRPWERPSALTAVGRFGVTTNYRELYLKLKSVGISLIHTPEQYHLCSELTEWYPKLSDLTPRSVWFSTLPSVSEVKYLFDWPIFVKGSRQTSRHSAELSIIHSPKQFERMLEVYQNNPILHWQPLVCREYVNLRSVPGKTGEKIPPAFEFRTFWWYGVCVGAGPYWAAYSNYQWTRVEEYEALSVAQTAAERLKVPFLVVDIAQTIDGQWIVIECNDGQESGYTGIAPISLWQTIVDIEKSRNGSIPWG